MEQNDLRDGEGTREGKQRPMVPRGFQLPKIASTICRRAKIQAWLEFHADVPLRYVWSAAGSGKTTVAVLYARSRSTPVVYVAVEPHTTAAEFYTSIALAAQIEPAADYGVLLNRLACLGRVEIIVDNVDRANPAVSTILEKMYRDTPDSVTFVYLARSGEALAVGIGEAQGLVARSDPALFVFDTSEITLFAQTLGLDEAPSSIARLWSRTSGWPIAVAGVCRYAAGHATPLGDAWMQWLRGGGLHVIKEIVADALREVAPAVAEGFRRLLAGQHAGDARSMDEFMRHGLFVVEREGRLMLNPLLEHDQASANAAFDGHPLGPATVEMFGRFDFRIDGQPVEWQRRRDREIVQYLAMRPDGRATRVELIACFWPDADRQLASQSLRTACSTIRRAFARRVGLANVARYFVAGIVVELKPDAVSSTVGRFIAHIEHGDRAFDAADVQGAFAHYAAAEKLYRAPFLAGEAPAAWAAPHHARLTSSHARCSARLEQLSLRVTSEDAAAFRSITDRLRTDRLRTA